MDEETVDKILDFFKDIIAQLGPAGEQAYRIVYTRVMAESIISVITGVLSLLIAIGITVWCMRRITQIRTFNKGTPYSYEQKDAFPYFMTSMIFLAMGIIIFLILVPYNIINLISLDYATIERILNLAGAAR